MSDEKPAGPAWRPPSAALMASIAQASRARRADCPAFVEEFLEMYAADASADGLDREWTRLVTEYPWYADDVLHCVDATLADPRRELPRMVTDVAIAYAEASGGDVSGADKSYPVIATAAGLYLLGPAAKK